MQKTIIILGKNEFKLDISLETRKMNYEEAKVTVRIKYFSNSLRTKSERTRTFVDARCTCISVQSAILSETVLSS